MNLLIPFLPLAGVLVGWLLTTGRDVYISRQIERSTFRKCTFYLLRAWKALLDYERAVTYLTTNRPSIEDYEPLRSHFADRFLQRITEDGDSLQTGIEMLASVDPTAAVQLDNTVKNIRFVLKDGFTDLVRKDPDAYVELMNRHNDLIDWTLGDFEAMGERLAGECGFFDRRRVTKWFSARKAGSSEVKASIESFAKSLAQRKKEPESELTRSARG